jgi:two-component system sensor histidine kinase UhpB
MKFNKAQTDLLWVAACLLLYVFLAFEFEFFEQIFHFTQSYERLQLDELLLALLILGMGLAWYSWRRSQEAKQEVQERIRSESKVQELLSHNSDLAQRLFTAQEDERRALARELHDEMGQTCTAIRTEAAVLAGGQLTPAAVLDSAQRIADSAQALSWLTRDLLQRLRPAVLDSMGLADALSIHCEQWQTSNGVVCTFESQALPAHLDDYVCVTIYRLLQESLTNVAKHANATRVEVQLSLLAPHGLALRVHDNGQGMHDPMAHHAGFGLLGMRERALSLGGRLHLQSALGQGFLVLVELPLEAK